MSRRYFIKTFGCQMNEYDSARMADVLEAAVGLARTEDPAEADPQRWDVHKSLILNLFYCRNAVPCGFRAGGCPRP